MSLGTDLAAAVALITTDAGYLRAIVQGPASGPTSIVTIPGVGDIKTIARASSEIPGGAVIMDGNGDATVTRDLYVGRNARVTASSGPKFTLNSTAVGSWKSWIEFLNAGTGKWQIGVDINGAGQGNLFFFDTINGSTRAYMDGNGLYVTGLGQYTGALAVGGSISSPVNGDPVLNSHGPAGTGRYLRWQSGTAGTPVRWDIGVTGDAESGANAGSNFFITRWDDAGVASSALKISRNAGDVYPGTDNLQSSGGGSNRWSVVYAGTGTINTSGRDAKRNIRELSAAERRVAARIKAGGRLYQFADAVEAKGEAAARLHFGVIAEDVAAAFTAEGLDPARYGMFCADKVFKQETYTETERRPKMQSVEVEGFEEAVEDGKVVRRVVTRTREEPVTEIVPLVDAAGMPILEPEARAPDAPVFLDVNGQPAEHLVPATRAVPVMEEVEVEKVREVETDEIRYGLRYDQLTLFLLLAAE